LDIDTVVLPSGNMQRANKNCCRILFSVKFVLLCIFRERR